MFSNFKLSLQAFKKKIGDYLGISFVFGVIIFLGVIVGELVLGWALAYIIIAIPTFISLKFCAFQSYDKSKIEYRSLKIGFLTFFKSIKIYALVVFKPILIGAIVSLLIFSPFFSEIINIASKTIPNVKESLGDVNTFYYTLNDVMNIKEANKLFVIGQLVSLGCGFLIYYILKLERDFIPFIAFEMPINSTRSIALNKKILKGKFFKFILINLLILLLFAIPGALSFLIYTLLKGNEVLSQTTIFLITMMAFCMLCSPLAMFKQLFYIYSYKSMSKPYKDDFDNELKEVIKELERISKSIDKNDEK